jgi:hypothetical protein
MGSRVRDRPACEDSRREKCLNAKQKIDAASNTQIKPTLNYFQLQKGPQHYSAENHARASTLCPCELYS